MTMKLQSVYERTEDGVVYRAEYYAADNWWTAPSTKWICYRDGVKVPREEENEVWQKALFGEPSPSILDTLDTLD